MGIAGAVNKEKLCAVTFKHCGACGWHYEFWAVFDGDTKVWLGPENDAYWREEFGAYGTFEAGENARRWLDTRSAELLAELLAS